eukprot:gene14982-20155_t
MSDTDNLSSFLSNDQQSTLRTFQEISNIEDESLCIQILQSNNWNLESALNQFVGNAANTNNNSSTGSTGAIQRSRANNASNNTNRSITNNRTANQNNNNNGNSLDSLLTPLRWLFQSRPQSMQPEQDTLKFIDDYHMKYSENHPLFHPNSYLSAVSQAFQQSKFLLVYLHSPIHEDTNRFCRQVLSSNSLINLTNQHAVVWAGSVWYPEAYGLCTQLKASAFPFLALLLCQSNRVVQRVDLIQGYMEERELVDRLQTSINRHNGEINRQRLETMRRDEAAHLREQQDREYRESMEADSREERRRLQQEREAELLENERKAREELEQAVELSKKLTQEDKMRKLNEYFISHPEPAQGSSKDISEIRFQLPNGMKLTRRFLKFDQVQVIFDFLTLHFGQSNSPIVNFSVSKNYPKVELNDPVMTLESLDLHPRGMLYVQDLDA